MGDKKEYRSAIRSRKLIRKAFMELLKEKSFEKITVTDIVKRADINRSTFYAHYPDVMGIIDEVQNDILEYAEKVFEEIDFKDLFKNPYPLLRKIVKIAEDNHELYRVLANTSIAVKELEKIKLVLINRTIQYIDFPDEYEKASEFEFTLRFYMGGVVDAYTQWINGEIDCSLDELTEKLARLIMRAV